MFRNSAWLLCVILLCVGHALSDTANQNKEEKVSLQQHKESLAANSVSKNVQDTHVSPLNGDDSPKPTHSTTSITGEIKPATAPTSTKPAPSSTSEPPKTSSPTPPSASTSTKPAPSSTPEPPKTSASTKPAPSSTPEPPKTSSPTTPTTPPPAPPTTTPAIPVTPQPGPQKGSWNVTTDKNITCIIIEGIFSIDAVKNKTNYHFDIPRGAKSHGDCKLGKIVLTWYNNTHVNNLEFKFENDSKTYDLKSFSGEVFIWQLNETLRFNTNTNVTHFDTPLNQSYSCSSMKQLAVNDNVKVTLDQFHLQAFKSSNTTGFDASVDCAGSAAHTPDIVPIIVGCVLALLVIAVLVAYLISRRRSQTRGYLSM